MRELFEKEVNDIKKFKTKKELRKYCDDVYVILVHHGHNISIQEAIEYLDKNGVPVRDNSYR